MATIEKYLHLIDKTNKLKRKFNDLVNIQKEMENKAHYNLRNKIEKYQKIKDDVIQSFGIYSVYAILSKQLQQQLHG